jgi:hypothetical protein
LLYQSVRKSHVRATNLGRLLPWGLDLLHAGQHRQRLRPAAAAAA